MKKNSIDDFFKNRIDGLKVDPSDEVWKNIESQFFKSRSTRNKSILLWALALILLSLGVGSFFYISNKSKTTEIISNTQNDINQIKVTIPMTNEELDIASDDIVNTELHEKSTQLKNEAIIIVDSETILDNNEIVNTVYNTNSKPYSITNEILSLEENYHLRITPLSNKMYSDLNNNIQPSIIQQPEIITLNEYIEKRNKRHMYTGASASAAITYYPTSTDQLSWSTDLIYGYKLNHIYIETGIGFQKMKEQGVFQIDYRTSDSVGYYNKVLSFAVNPDNPNEITYNTKSTTVYDSVDHFLLQSPIYSYNYLVVPLKVGYKFMVFPKFSVSAETGIIYSLLNKTETPNITYDDPNTNLIGIQNNTPSRVEHNFRIHAAIRLNYSISRTISIVAQPEFTKYLNSINEKSPTSNKVKPYTMGVKFGILFDF